MSDKIIPIQVPKWGLTMEEGKIVDWLLNVGDQVTPGEEILEIETSKITNVVEAQSAGVLRRIIVEPGETLPVGALLGVMTSDDVADAEIDAFVAHFQENFVPEEASGETEAAEPQFADVGSNRISYMKAGPEDADATPLVLIHGFGGDANSWLFNIDAVATDRPVFAIDLPGHGRSSKTVGDGSVETLANIVLGFLDFIGAEKVHLVGHSLGAAIAAEIASQNSGRVKSLTLVAPAGLSDTINGEFLGVFSHANSRGELKPAMTSLFADKSLVTRDLLNETLKALRIDGAREALQAIEKACFASGQQTSRYDEFIAAGMVPSLIIVGENDEIVPPPEGMDVKLISGAGHMPHMEAAGEVNALLSKHIQNADA